MIKKVLVLVLTLTFTVGAFGQSLEETLSNMLSDNATMYIQPMGDGMGALMNSGYYHRSRVHKMLGFDLSFKLMGLSVDDDSKFFEFALPTGDLEFNLNDVTDAYGDLGTLNIPFAEVYKDANTTVPTVSADKDEVGTIAVNDGNLIGLIESQLLSALTDALGDATAAGLAVDQLSGDITTAVGAIPDISIPGLGLHTMALPMPQFALGLPMGIELTLRGFPEYDFGEEIGVFSMYGGGARINIDQFIPIPLFPVDITAGAFYSQMAIGDIFSSSNTALSLQVGKSINLLVFGLGVYVDAGYETSTIDIKYDVPESAGLGVSEVEFNMETDPGLRLGAGLHLKLIPLTYLNVHAAQTPNNMVVTAGLGISLR